MAIELHYFHMVGISY